MGAPRRRSVPPVGYPRLDLVQVLGDRFQALDVQQDRVNASDNPLSSHTMLMDPARPDGYRPITNPIWVWARFTGRISAGDLRVLWNAGRRLDAAHRQFEHLRNSLDHVADATPGSVGWRRRMFDALGDAELAIIALSRALQLALGMSSTLRLQGTHVRVVVPKVVKRRADDVRQLRRKCEHLEKYELQRLLAEEGEGFATFRALRLFTERRVVYEPHSLDIDGEATDLMIQTRDYLVKVGIALSARQ